MRITKKNIIITTTKTTITTNKLKSRYNRNRKYLRIFIRNQKYTYENKRMYVCKQFKNQVKTPEEQGKCKQQKRSKCKITQTNSDSLTYTHTLIVKHTADELKTTKKPNFKQNKEKNIFIKQITK